MSPFPNSFGVYFWAGYDVPNALVPGLQILQQAGFQITARIRLAPAVRPISSTDRGEYRFDEIWESEVPSTAPFLPAAVRSTQYQRAFSLPWLRTFVFTAYDSASTGPFGNQSNHFKLDWLNLNAEMVRSEYRDMTVALYETQNGTGKRFIVCNWETDSDIFGKAAPHGPLLQAMRYWFQLRQEGIRQGREIALQNGWGGVEVNDAIEFNSLYYRKMLQEDCSGGFVGDTLRSLIKEIKPDYASFSAWESTGRGRLYDDLMTIKQFLHTETYGHTQLIIGELGVTCHAVSKGSPCLTFEGQPAPEDVASKAWRYIKLAHAAVRAEIPVVILWKAWDYFGKNEGEGLLNSNGTERQVLRDLRASFGSTLKISGVVDQFDMYGMRADDGNRYFELYGSFPEANPGNVTVDGWAGHYTAIVEFSDGEVLAIDTWGESASQINLPLRPDDHKVRWFMLRVRRKRDGLMSPEFGPVRLNRIPADSSECADKVTNRFWDHWA